MEQSRDSQKLAALTGLDVLIVDDDADSRELLVTLLETRHARVSSASSAGEGFERLVEERPDVLISDIGMPGEDGYSLIRRVRALPDDQGGGVPAIALTAFNQEQDRQRSLVAGFSKHMSKPVDVAQLCAEILRLGAKQTALPIDRLRSATRVAHERLEALHYSEHVMNGTLSVLEYGLFLRVMSVVHQGLEAAVDASSAAVRAVFGDDMRRVSLLQEDLRELGFDKDDAADPERHARALAAVYVAAHGDTGFLLGSMYVLEGASLGGRAQLKAIRARGELSEHAHRYLSGYGQDTYRHFEQFAQRLNAALATEALVERAIDGAMSTFGYMEKSIGAISVDTSASVGPDDSRRLAVQSRSVHSDIEDSGDYCAARLTCDSNERSERKRA